MSLHLPAVCCTVQLRRWCLVRPAMPPACHMHGAACCCIWPTARASPHLRRRVVLLAELHDVHTLQQAATEHRRRSGSWRRDGATPALRRHHSAAACHHAQRCPCGAATANGAECCTAPVARVAALPSTPCRLLPCPSAGGGGARRGRTLAPRAGPTGGAGLALPAGSASLIMPVTAGGGGGVRRGQGRSRKCTGRCPRTLPSGPGPTHPWPPCK